MRTILTLSILANIALGVCMVEYKNRYEARQIAVGLPAGTKLCSIATIEKPLQRDAYLPHVTAKPTLASFNPQDPALVKYLKPLPVRKLRKE